LDLETRERNFGSLTAERDNGSSSPSGSAKQVKLSVRSDGARWRDLDIYRAETIPRASDYVIVLGG